MSIDYREKAFEEAIIDALISPGVEVVREVLTSSPYQPGGYYRRRPDEYDRARRLIPRDVIDFITATQPREWEKLKQYHGIQVKERFLARLTREVERRGTLEVLRRGIKDWGCKFRLAYFTPASALNPELRKLHAANIFSVVRQLRYSEQNENSIDLVIFLNGLPLFTAELKNPLTGQDVQDAIKQYRFDRDHSEPLFAFGRCLAHFAVDPDLVFVTTQLQGAKTRFLPFNQGKFGGAGNPPMSPTETGYPSEYLWQEVWAKDSVLNLVQHFIHEVEDEDEQGRKTGRRRLIFPRYHQLDAVRRLVVHARERGPGQNYLIQHSAGSGKSASIAWLAHQLSILHDDSNQRIFDSIIVITDRRVLDRQLQRTVRQFEQTRGVVENIDTTSRQLKEALESGKTIIVTTLQKFPVIVEQVGELPGQRFAVIVDEAHSSQTGESVSKMKAVLSVDNLAAAEAEDMDDPEDLEDRIVSEMTKRGRLPNVSTFAFTATPKRRTLELFGNKCEDGSYEPFSLYSMRQAIEEGFILDVLENYTTYKTYWRLLKTIEEDPRYERAKATYLLRSFVDLHEHAVRKKAEIMADHFHEQVAEKIGGKAKAMIVTRSRLHAVRYHLTLKDYLKEKGYPYKSLVAFSGTVRDGGIDYTEANMNGFPEVQTAKTFEKSGYRFLVVANKFQTGFDQPLLHTMYVDKKLGGVHAVQTLSRLNRIHPEKDETMVLDFANEAAEIQEAFQDYYEKTILSEGTDPNLLHDLENRLEDFHVYIKDEVEAFAKVYFSKKGTQDRLYATLRPGVDRFCELAIEDQAEFRSLLNDYVRLYAFLSQVIPFADPELGKLYLYARFLSRYLPYNREELPREVQQNIDMESYRIRKQHDGKIALVRGDGQLDPQSSKDYKQPVDEVEVLSLIIQELNSRFGTDFTDEDKVFICQLEDRLAEDPSLVASIRVNPPENARLTFDHVVSDRLQDMVETNFKFYKRVTDDRDFAKYFLDWLFHRFLEKHNQDEFELWGQ